MSLITYSKKMFVERIRRHIANGFPTSEFSITPNEMLLYIDAEIASSMIGASFGMAKIEGVLTTPEAYIVTTELSALVQDNNTGEWYAELPQTPISLPLGYSITNAYFADGANGKSQPIFLIKPQRSAFRDYMPKPSGVSGRVKGNKIYLKAKDNTPLSNLTAFVDMVSTRTNDINESMNLPDDILNAVFDKVVQRCLQRMGLLKDVIKDDQPSSNTNVRQ